jgi:hypothetical protein
MEEPLTLKIDFANGKKKNAQYYTFFGLVSRCVTYKIKV